MTQKILLLTKNYPPQVGGIEKYAYDLHTRLIAEGNKLKIIAAGPRNEQLLIKIGTNSPLMRIFWKICYVVSELRRLLFFATRCMTIGLYYSYASNIVWSLDGSVAPIGFLLGKVTHRKTRATIHGTDIVWNRKMYQALVPKIIAKIDEIYVISENTRQECLKRGIITSKITLVPHTLNTITFTDPGKFNKIEFLKNLGAEKPDDKIILFSIGRWIERKGFHWFLERVMPALDGQKFHFILAGFGSFEGAYREIINEYSLENVTIVGKIDDLTKAKLFISSDYFVMPNLHIQDDLEGFGLVLLESQFYGTLIMASDADGIELNRTGPNALILQSENAPLWIDTINSLATKLS